MQRPPAPLAVTWIGHATVLIELDGVRLLTDPVLRDRIGPLVRIAPGARAQLAEGVDAVLISHLHADHADPRSLLMIGRSTRVVAPRGAGGWLRRQGLRAVEELARGEQLRVGTVQLRATPALHGGRRWRFGAEAPPIGLVASGSQSCYFAGDTGLHSGMSALAGQIDLALLPIWGWGSRVGPGHLDPASATAAAELIAPRVVVPIHWGTFALAWRAARLKDPGRPARRFSELMAERLPSVQVRILSPGGCTEVVASAG